MLCTRLASLALAAGLIPFTGCCGWFGNRCCCPGPAPCCSPSPCCGGAMTGCCGSPVDGFGGVVGTPCCNSNGLPTGEGPVLMPQAPLVGPPAVPPVPPAGDPGSILAPEANPRLVPAPQQAAPIPYTPTRRGDYRR